MTRDRDIASSAGSRASERAPAAEGTPRHRRQRGQAIAELAIIAPVMLLVMLVAVDFGRLFFSYIAVQNAAREATTYAAYHAADDPWDEGAYRASVASAGAAETNAQVQGGTGTLAIAHPVCFDPQTSATLDCSSASDFAAGIGNQVRVSASQSFTFMTPVVGQLFGGALTLSATATAPIMNPRDVDIEPGPSAAPSPTVAPTPTPTPTPTPSPSSPGATPTPTPAPTPTPTPTPVPTCTVPNFKNGFWNNIGGVPATTVWSQAGFTGTLENRAGTDKIKGQGLSAGSKQLCTLGTWVDD